MLSCPVEVLCLGPSGDSSVYRFSRSSSSCLEAGKERSVSGLFLPVWVLRAPCSSQPGDPETRLHTLHATLVSIHQNGTVSPTLGPQSYRIGEKSNLFTPRPNQIGSTPPSYLGKQVKIFRLETATLYSGRGQASAERLGPRAHVSSQDLKGFLPRRPRGISFQSFTEPVQKKRGPFANSLLTVGSGKSIQTSSFFN